MAMAMAARARPSRFAVLSCLALLLLPHAATTTTTPRRTPASPGTGWAAPSSVNLGAGAPPHSPPPSTTTLAGPGTASPPRSDGAARPRRRELSDDCFQLPHATCAVYPYDPVTRSVDRACPVGGLREACLHPLCAAAGSFERNLSSIYGQCQGRWGDPLHAYCVTTSLAAQRNGTWRVLPLELPVADPDTAGGDFCYVELAHLNYREGYYVHCPAFNCSHVPHVACTEFPPAAVASAVWEHRRTTYRDTVGPLFGRYTYDI